MIEYRIRPRKDGDREGRILVSRSRWSGDLLNDPFQGTATWIDYPSIEQTEAEMDSQPLNNNPIHNSGETTKPAVLRPCKNHLKIFHKPIHLSYRIPFSLSVN
jgi:hypothetical protein